MARNHAECQAMIAGCQAADVPLFVAYYRRALPRFQKIKTLLDEGAIGEPRLVTVTLYQPPSPDELDPAALPWRVRPDIAGAGRFLDLASHMLDFLDFALGPIRAARGFAANQAGRYPAEDIVSGAFVFEAGAQGMGTWCFTAYGHADRTEIVGTQGKLTYSTFDAQPITLTTAAGVTELAYDYPAHIQQPLIQSVVEALNGVGECPSTGASGARTSRVMDALLRPNAP